MTLTDAAIKALKPRDDDAIPGRLRRTGWRCHRESDGGDEQP